MGERLGVFRGKSAQHVAVVRVTVEGGDPRFEIICASPHRNRRRRCAGRNSRSPVDRVHEREYPDLRELLPQSINQPQRELRETGDRSGDIADDHQFRTMRSRFAVNQVDGYPTVDIDACNVLRTSTCPRCERRRRISSLPPAAGPAVRWCAGSAPAPAHPPTGS